jgi:hypothetical protein
MIKQILLVCLMALAANAFAPITSNGKKNSALKLAMMPPPPPPYQAPTTATTSAAAVVTKFPGPSARLEDGIQSYLQQQDATASLSSTSVTLSLQERKIPTPEEIAAKKRNFNLIFWGGGFVAPFAATIFYFGFKFWEK